jgi:hypothetical protein
MPQSVKENLVAAFRYLLKPLVRLATKNGVSFPEFSEALKQAFVTVAADQMRLSGKGPTEEGISLIANIQKTEVRQILESGSEGNLGLVAQQSNPLARVLAAWHTDVKYNGPYGVLRDLPFSLKESEARKSDVSKDEYTFTQLVADYCPGISPQDLLDELIRTGCVQDVGKSYFRAVKRSYVPSPLSARSILLFARVVHNICEAAEVNLRAESVSGKGLIQRSIYTRYGITKQDLKAFDKFIRERGQIFADDIDNWLSERDKEDCKDSVKTGVDFYHYIVNEEDELALSKELPH